ncbi:hypothetical protein [Maritimibacter sp. UBA3975]|uniref:hypothetical protein n=1 Tax=Maritimibacter sp. UBA3975 TaxID=1946833 RepID=UPI000C0A9BE5|nr:hypothetical protein [Maritimibacter sp. UBA3975]MAM63005.1 hypothetical protein [Maritimibacter sp.]|tara:strand:+ start:5577 stop:5927 length:351 start_codon:yes stop_codon:yes gene_type:complete
MTIINKTAIAAFALITSATGGSALAGNAGESMPACINHVVNACNENSNHPEACTEAGLSACEELHGLSEQTALPKIKIFEAPNGTYRVVIGDGPSRPQTRVPTAEPNFPGTASPRG